MVVACPLLVEDVRSGRAEVLGYREGGGVLRFSVRAADGAEARRYVAVLAVELARFDIVAQIYGELMETLFGAGWQLSIYSATQEAKA